MGGMYGGRSSYGGMGGGMYGGGMSGGGGMYGQQGMGGMGGQQGEFFAPKQQELLDANGRPLPPQQDEANPPNDRITEIKELNTSYLDSIAGWGDRSLNFIRRLVKGFLSFHAALMSGTLPPHTARKAILAVGAIAAGVIALIVRSANRQKQRGLAADPRQGALTRWPAAGAPLQPHLRVAPAGWPRASL